ncbi:MAG: hypothetical protein L0206_13540 [Actinobacteria bacterium]|nr:hypothetical protein [Actinomycetota bacterium]
MAANRAGGGDGIELRGRARRLGVDIELVRKDYVLNHVLAAVAESADDIVFRGGTALARVYWPDFRILANKWYMLDDRKEPRGLFDLWSGICVREVSLDWVAEGFEAKYRAKPSLWRIERARKLEAAWEERLAHQVNDLPPFRDVYGQVRARVRAWEEVGWGVRRPHGAPTEGRLRCRRCPGHS